MIETTADGLLSAINANVIDKSSELITKLKELGEAAVPVIKSLVEDGAQKQEFTIVLKVDITDLADVSRVNAALSTLRSGLTFQVRAMGQNSDAIAESDTRGASLWLPLPQPYRLTLSEGNVVLGEALVSVPHPTRTIPLDVSRAAFASADTKLTMTEGRLTKFDYSKGSEAVGAASIPIDIAKAFVSIPAALFDFKVKKVQDDKELVAAQQELLDSRSALLVSEQNSQRALETPRLESETALINAQIALLEAQRRLIEAQQKGNDGNDEDVE